MRYTIILFFLIPLFTQAQSIAWVKHYKAATAIDTVFTDTSGLVRVNIAQITINGTQYAAIHIGDYTVPLSDYTYEAYTLANGWSALVCRFSNLELERVTVDEGGKQETYFTR